MGWIEYGGIPQHGIGLYGWPQYGIPGSLAEDEGGGIQVALLTLTPDPSGLVFRSDTVTLRIVRRAEDDEISAFLALN